MSTQILQMVRPVMGEIEKAIDSCKELSPFKKYEKMEKEMAEILPAEVDYDIIFRAGDKVQHVFFEKENPRNAILL